MATSKYHNYIVAVSEVSKLAQRDLRKVFDKLDMSKPAECKRVLLVAVPAIVVKYGNVAGLAAAEYYESERHAAVGGSYLAKVAPPVDINVIQAKVRYAMGHIFEEN